MRCNFYFLIKGLIFALNQTKLLLTYHNRLTKIEGYQHYRFDRTANGNGVCLNIKDSIKHLKRDDLQVKDLELICAEIKPPKSKSCLLVTWYRPSSSPVDCFKILEANLGYLGKEEKEHILLGETHWDFSECFNGHV